MFVSSYCIGSRLCAGRARHMHEVMLILDAGQFHSGMLHMHLEAIAHNSTQSTREQMQNGTHDGHQQA